MKKMMSMMALVLLSAFSFAQVQRSKTTTLARPDSTLTGTEKGKAGGMGKKQMMKDLNLSKEQKMKLKELRQSAQAKKQAIENDDKLSAPEKESKLKELHKEQAKNTMSILSPEQKVKMLKMRKEKKGMEMDEMDNE
jgi:Spy/CpxP family protein refolding chaperone